MLAEYKEWSPENFDRTYGGKYSLAGKTGTSQDNADAWFAAFNPSLVIVTRVGASSPSVHFNSSSNGSGSALALPLTALTLKKVQENQYLFKKLITPFPVLSSELAAQLGCPDYKEKNLLDKFIDLFKRDEIIFDKEAPGTVRRKRPFLKRIFSPINSKRFK